MFSSNCN